MSRALRNTLIGQVRIAFDHAVLFDDKWERVYQRRGLEEFQRREAELAEELISWLMVG